MRLREITKMNSINDGTRTLFESIVAPEVLQAIKHWSNEMPSDGVLIGGLALSYYVKPRATMDCDFLFLSADQLPYASTNFKRHRNGAFLHKPTHVEIETVVPSNINMNPVLAKQIVDSAVSHGNVKIASIGGLIVSKLIRFSLQDRADINALLQICSNPSLMVDHFEMDERITANWKIALADL